ncbi:MAG: NADPH:quinone oxidoreductase [Firmicutes bacterium]|nr:NADPH:quinone oxidoreductase [Bacillota bacterium]
MKAMVITAFGGPEVFEQRDVPKPEAGPGEVLVRVKATSINPLDYKIREAGAWAGVQPPAVIGYDVAGTVVAVGPGAQDFAPGDLVYYTPDVPGRGGSYAEFHVARQSIVASMPRNLSFEEAASIPLAGGTAWLALITRGQLHVGETVLIHAGAGGVGSLAVQIARAAGAYVFATCSPGNRDLVQELGAHRVIDYHSEDVTGVVLAETAGRGVDFTFDTVGGKTLEQSVAATRPHGRIVSVVSNTGNINDAHFKNITVHFTFLERQRHTLDHLRPLLERGQIRAVIDSIMPLEEVAEAHRRVERGGVRGKVVLTVPD